MTRAAEPASPWRLRRWEAVASGGSVTRARRLVTRARIAVAGAGFVGLTLTAGVPATTGQSGQDSPARSDSIFRAAAADWDRGEYVAALEGFLRVLDSPSADRFLDSIAVTTGELYHTYDVAPDGRNARFSPDGGLIAFETGDGADRRTRIVEARPPFREVAELPGHGAVFRTAAAGTDIVAYLKVDEDETLAAARTALEEAVAAGTAPEARMAAQARLRWAEAERTRLAIRHLPDRDEELPARRDMYPLEMAFSPSGATMYVAVMDPGDPAGSQILSIPISTDTTVWDDRVPGTVFISRGYPSDLHVTPDGRTLVYVLSGRSPLPDRPGEPSLDDPDIGHQVVIEDLTALETVRPGRAALREVATLAYPGAAPTLSADGSTLAFYSMDGGDHVVVTIALDGECRPVIAHRASDPLGVPVLSPSGRLVAFHQRPGVSWNLYVVGSDGAVRRPIGEDVQHEVFPVFLSEDRILAVMGEFRHRRSQLYDLRTGTRTRLFHNNSVRTIAPQYEWEPSPDGRRVLIVAERDGDTVSPEQGVYLMNVERRVTTAELRARLEQQLAGERELRAQAQAMFSPIADRVRAATERVSGDRLYEYQEALYSFGSKHMTMPGNRPAGEYIHQTLASFGYEPEYQWFEPTGDVRTANVVAVLPGTERPELIVVLSSHYDSVRGSPGADDNSSGTSVLLETARVLADTPLPVTVVFAALTAEESGLLGAREFVRLARERGDRIVGVLNNDMLGWTRDHRLDNTVRYTDPRIRDMQHGGAILFSDLITYDSRYVRGTDAAVFWEAYGDITGGIGSYPVLSNPNYHQPTDRLETINQALVTETARATVAALMMLASSPPDRGS